MKLLWILKCYENIDDCDKRSKNHFLVQEIKSCHKKSIHATRNPFLSQEINSCQKTSVLVKSHTLVKPFYQYPTTREAYKKKLKRDLFEII